jgi:toxin-antitoxin system PIN domain toxin
MLLIDATVLLRAHRLDAPSHNAFRHWLERVVESDAPFSVPDLVLTDFVRIVTNPRIFTPPTPLEVALAAADALRDQPTHVPLATGPRHFAIFSRLCREAGAYGPLAADARLAALAIETGSELATTDRGFRRFSGLRVVHPLDD